MISAGRVLLMPKGDYDPNTTYEMLDIVSYNGSSYIAKGTTTGNLPTNTTYWQLSAYGGQASNIAGNFAPLETTDYATRPYQVDEIFVDKDSQLVIATDAINIGDEIEIGSNCEITSIADLLDDIKDHYDALDQRNRKLIGITQLTAQTDLHSLVPGEYYKKLTNFYVTNGPTGVNQVPTAVFRLTVESGLDENSSSILLTIRASDGKVYTQSYDGTSWSAWVEVASKAYVDSQISSLGTAASKDSTNAITEDSTDLVESGAVYTGLSAKANTADLGTAAYKDSTNAVTSGSSDLVESGAVHSAIQTVSNKVSNSGDAYSSSTAYKVGDLVIHDNKLYRCITACSAATWSVNQSCFTADTLTNVASLLNTNLSVKTTWLNKYNMIVSSTDNVKIKTGHVVTVSIVGEIDKQFTQEAFYDITNYATDVPLHTTNLGVIDNYGNIWKMKWENNVLSIACMSATVAANTYIYLTVTFITAS